MGNVTTFYYDAAERLIEMVEPARLVAPRNTVDPFLDHNPLVLDPFHDQVMTAPVTTYLMNAFGQVVLQIRTADGGGFASVTIRHLYDAAGNLVRTTDGNDNDTRYQVDYAGRTISQIQAIEYLSFSGEITQTLLRHFAYDAAGHQTDVMDSYRDESGVLQQTGTHLNYDAFGEVTGQYKVWGAANMAIADMLASASNHALVASYGFDTAGHLIQQDGPDGLTKYFYDLVGDLTRQEQHGTLPDSSTGVRITETAYDEQGHAILQRLPRFGIKVSPQNTIESFGITPYVLEEYDRWGNVVLRTSQSYIDNTTGAVSIGQITQYRYNADNQVIAEKLPRTQAYRTDGTFYLSVVTHETHYDVLGRAVKFQDVAQNVGDLSSPAQVLRTRTRQYNAVGS